MGKKKAPAPTDSNTGAARIQAAMVELFDRQDGTGADWQLMAESVFRAGFGLVDDKLDAPARQSFMRRIHAGAYERMTGESSGDDPAPQKPRPSVAGPFSVSAPIPPK